MKIIRFILLIFSLTLGYLSHSQVTPDYFIQKGIREYQDGNYSEAIADIRRALSLDSTRKEAYYLLSAAYLGNSQPSKSLDVSRDGIKRFPYETELWWTAAEAELQLKNYSDALELLKELNEIFEDSGNLPSNVSRDDLLKRLTQVYTHLGNQAIDSGNNKLAVSYFLKANQHMPEQPFTYANLAFALLQNNNWDRALEIADRGLQKFPDQENLIKAKASALYKQEDYKTLTTEYAKLHRNNPENLDYAITYGELLMANQQFQEASDLYNQLIRNHPKEKDIYGSLINVYESKLNYEGKIRVLKLMLPHFDKAEIYERIAESLEMMNRWSKARKYYDTLLTLRPDDLNIRKKIAQSYVKDDSLDQAESYNQKLLEEHPDDTELLISQGEVLEKQGKWSEALEIYDHLHRLTSSTYSKIRLGKVYQIMEQPAMALKYYNEVISTGEEPSAYLGASELLQPEEPDSAFVLAREAFKQTFNELEKIEDELEDVLGPESSLLRLAGNRDLIQEAEKMDALATKAFFHLTSFDYLDAEQAILDVSANFSESAKMHYLIGKFYFENDALKKALHRLRLSVQLNPNLKESHLILGKIQLGMSNHRDAIMAFERVITLDKYNKEAYRYLVNLYRSEDRLDLLCEKWLARYQAEKENDLLREHLIEALHKAGRKDMARKIIDQDM